MSSSSGEIVESGAEAPRGGRDPGPGGDRPQYSPRVGARGWGEVGAYSGQNITSNYGGYPRYSVLFVKGKDCDWNNFYLFLI